MLFKKTCKEEDLFDSSFKNGYLETDVQTLLIKLGIPSFISSPDGKTQLEWAFKNHTHVITIYDYKQYKSINEIREWHIGGKNITNEQINEFIEQKELDSFHSGR